MRVSQVTVDFKKTVSDGNYGNETANVQYVVLLDEGEDADQVVREVITRARGRAMAELGGSESLSVRRALNPPKRLCSECGEELGDEDSGYHDPCYEVYKARRKAEDEERRARYAAEEEDRRARWATENSRSLVGVTAAQESDEDHSQLDEDDDDDF